MTALTLPLLPLGALSAADDSIRVVNPTTLPATLPAERIPIGIAGDHKSNLVSLSTGELLMDDVPFLRPPDGTLITPYPYRDAQDQTRVEALRWRLP